MASRCSAWARVAGSRRAGEAHDAARREVLLTYHHFSVSPAGDIIDHRRPPVIAADYGRSRQKPSEALAAGAHERHIGGDHGLRGYRLECSGGPDEHRQRSAGNERFHGRMHL